MSIVHRYAHRTSHARRPVVISLLPASRLLASRLLALLLLPALACTGTPTPPAAARSEPTTSETAAPVATQARYVAPRPATDATLLTAPARVSADPSARGQVTAAVHGQIVRCLVRAGQTVSAGQPIVELRAPELLQAAAQLEGLRAQLAAHRERLAALDALAAEGLAKREVTFALRSQIAELAAQAGVAEAVLRGAGLSDAEVARMRKRGSLSVVAPVAGVIAALHAAPGAAYEPFSSPPLAEIVGVGDAWVVVELTRPPPRGLPVLFEALDGQRVSLRPQAENLLPGPGGGFVAFYRPVTADAPRLSEGLAGRVRFAPGDAPLFQLPLEALQPDASPPGSMDAVDVPQSLVRVLRAGEPLSVPVTVVTANATTALILGDLQASDQVELLLSVDRAEVGGATP